MACSGERGGELKESQWQSAGHQADRLLCGWEREKRDLLRRRSTQVQRLLRQGARQDCVVCGPLKRGPGLCGRGFEVGGGAAWRGHEWGLAWSRPKVGHVVGRQYGPHCVATQKPLTSARQSSLRCQGHVKNQPWAEDRPPSAPRGRDIELASPCPGNKIRSWYFLKPCQLPKKI